MKLTTAHAGDKIRFEFDGITFGPQKPSFVDVAVDEPLNISRIEPIPTDLSVPNAAEARVTIKTGDGDYVSGAFGVASDDALTCRKPLAFERSFRVEVSGPEKQRVRFALTGKLIPKDEM